ncbi:DUF2254 family protein [Streptomyces sp. M92]|uniref:DUF2254 family protein n=1 Tax=Streptomyces sp. M92 TaxID=2944250 RepID=UPI003FA7CA42
MRVRPRLAHRTLGTIVFRNEDDTARLTLSRPDWHTLLDLALAEIVLHGADSLQVHRRLRALLAAPASALPSHRATSLTPFHATLDHTVHALPTPALTDIAAIEDPQGLGGPAWPAGAQQPARGAEPAGGEHPRTTPRRRPAGSCCCPAEVAPVPILSTCPANSAPKFCRTGNAGLWTTSSRTSISRPGTAGRSSLPSGPCSHCPPSSRRAAS